MIFHLSINAHDPAKVAAVLAELLGADDIAAPTPPFPPGARMVCRFDERGSMVEVAPVGHAFVPGPAGEVQFAPSADGGGLRASTVCSWPPCRRNGCTRSRPQQAGPRR